MVTFAILLNNLTLRPFNNLPIFAILPPTMNQTLKTDILILGAGIGGYETFRSLEKQLRRAGIQKKITLIDQNNYFTFIPLMHEVAVGSVEPEHCTVALREIVAGTPHEFIKARVKSIDPTQKRIELDCPEIACDGLTYDYCVVALGSTINYFSVPGAMENTYHVRTLENALSFRHALINRFDSPDTHITISVVGGGPTGVEVAGHIAHLINIDLKRLYPKKTSIVRLIEKGPELASVLPLRARTLIAKRIRKLGVELMLNTGVNEVRPGELVLSTGQTIESDLTLWAVGIKNTAEEILPKEFCQNGRIPVNATLQHTLSPSLYAVGDMALYLNPKTGKPVPQLGETAHAQGQYVAKHMVAMLSNKTIKPFVFASKGSIMPVGEHYGIVVRGNLVFAGFFAWWVRRTVYVWFMPGIVRKLKIIIDWTLRLFGFADIISMNILPGAERRPPSDGSGK